MNGNNDTQSTRVQVFFGGRPRLFFVLGSPEGSPVARALPVSVGAPSFCLGGRPRLRLAGRSSVSSSGFFS